MRRNRRRGYTLLEVILALAIAVMLLAAVYSSVGFQLRQTQAGREIVEQTLLARAVLNRMNADVSAALTLGDAARFRRPSAQQSSSSSSGGSTTDPTAAASGTGTGTTTTPTTTDPTTGQTTTTAAVTVPMGVIGTASELHIFITKLPNEVLGTAVEGQIACDQRRLSYWVPDEESGLCKMELTDVTGDTANSTDLPVSDLGSYLYASEVKGVEFSYFDGTSWADSWDSTQAGSDGTTPMGSPRAIAITIHVATGKDGKLKAFRHVVTVQTAGGTPLQTPLGSSGTTTSQ